MGDGSAALIQLEDGWNNEIKRKALDPLENMLNDGFRSSKLFNNQEYVNIYTICYNMCTQRTPYNWSEQLYDRHGEQISKYLKGTVLPSLKEKSDEFLLTELVKRGENHKIMNKWYKKFFMYLDRYYVKYHSLPTLEEAGLRYFRVHAFDPVKKDVTAAILALIDKEREGASVDRDVIRQCVLLFETMGMGSLEVYTGDFEQQLLESTREFYARKSAAWVQEDSTPAYLIKAETALESERQRVKNYLNLETEPKLLRVLEEELLERREIELLEKEGSGCKALLVNDMGEDLSRMFRLFARVPEGLPPMADIVKLHIADVGNEKTEMRMARAEGKEEKETNDDPQFVKDLLAVHDKFIHVVTTQCAGHSLFQKALKDAFVEVVNREAGKFKTADLLSSFCDRILKTGSTEKLSDEEIEEFLEKTVQMFSYLSDKDLFAEIYRNQLAKRLLNQRSASEDMEKLMIGKLKLKCGAQFTAKMEGMLNDLSIGADHAKSFKEYCDESADAKAALGKLEFSVQVLTTGYWPTYKDIQMTLPPIMHSGIQTFKAFYDGKTSHRRLQWIHALGNATVKGTFGKKAFDFQLVTLQAVALIEFNGGNGPRPFNQLVEKLNLSEEVLKRVMHSLVCGKLKVLKKVGESSDKNAIRPTDEFVVNEGFSCPMRKVRIPMASLDESHNVKRVEEDRSIAIEASIVRIMKARKTLAHQQLVGEVLTQLAFFRPDPKVIKRRIEALIDREYLERDADNPNTYKYLA